MPKPRHRFRFAHIFVVLMVGCFIGLAWLVLRPEPEPVFEPAPRFLFHGRIGGVGEVNATLSIHGQACSLELNPEDDGSAWVLNGTYAGGNVVVAQTENLDATTIRTNRVIDATLTTNPLVLQGAITEVGSGQTREFELQGVATFTQVVRRSGIRFHDHGWSITAMEIIPEFIDPSTLEREANDWMKAGALESTSEFLKDMKPDWRDQWEYLKSASASAEWISQTSWNVEMHTPKIISLRSETYSYTGGAHGSSGTLGHTFWKQEGDVLGVELGDLFLTDSGWETNLAAAVVLDLARQGASQVVSAPPDKPFTLDLHNQVPAFTVTGMGVSFYFDPYDVGSYAEGAYRVFIPFKSMEGYLRTDGPVKDVRAKPGRRRVD